MIRTITTLMLLLAFLLLKPIDVHAAALKFSCADEFMTGAGGPHRVTICCEVTWLGYGDCYFMD